jgi:hypothetical protein
MPPLHHDRQCRTGHERLATRRQRSLFPLDRLMASFGTIPGPSGCRPTTVRGVSGTASSFLSKAASRCGRYRSTTMPARKMRKRALPEGYAAAPESGPWPGCDVLPAAERAKRGAAAVALYARIASGARAFGPDTFVPWSSGARKARTARSSCSRGDDRVRREASRARCFSGCAPRVFRSRRVGKPLVRPPRQAGGIIAPRRGAPI